jgi:hypothetical protein
LFRYIGDKFKNERGQFLSVENNNVIVTKKQSGWAARWDVKYVKDNMRFEPGEYHTKYGFYCDNRKFHIISKKDGRYLTQNL